MVKMIQSMTGFGRGTAKSRQYEVFVNITSLNSRFLDLNFHLPKALYYYQQELRELLTAAILRGKVSIYVGVTPTGTGNLGNLTADQLQRLVRQADEIARRLKLENDLRVSHLPAFAGFFSGDDELQENPDLWRVTSAAVKTALRKLQAMRQREGKALLQDFRRRLKHIEKLHRTCTREFAGAKENLRRELREKVRALLTDAELRPERLDTEIVLLAEKMDVSEELTRLRSHLTVFRETLEGEDPSVGKKLNFLLQEMNRETNTIASKSNTLSISHAVVTIKEELENIREQVQNVQ